jgi:PAS domain S-box-containing protein
LDLKTKFRLVVGVAASGLLTLSGFWLHSERSSLLAEKQEQAKNLVAIPYSIIAQQYRLEREGQINRGEAQRRAIESLKGIRYGDDNYFWINDMHPTMVMHPMKAQLDGEDLTNYKDPSGKALFVEMIRTVKKDGQGFVRYQWPRPGNKSERSVAKLSFVKGFEPWGWVIGTGIYIDDVDTAWRANAVTAGGLGLACLATLLIVSTSVSRSIFRRLGEVVHRMNDVAEGGEDFSKAIEVPSGDGDAAGHDEIAVLVAGFNEMLVQIQKRDEQLRRHSEHLEHQVAARTAELQTVNGELVTAHGETELFLECIPSILIGLDLAGHITRWNLAASQTFGVSEENAKGQTLDHCGIKWLHPDMGKEISEWLRTESALRSDHLAYESERGVRFVGVSVRPIFSKQSHKVGFIVTGADVTERKCLEEQLRQAHKLEAIGQLAAGIAHEINTPTQYISDNTTFLKESWSPILSLLSFCRSMQQEAAEKGSVSVESLAEFDRLSEQCEYGYLAEEIPHAIDQTLEGLQRVAKIVRAMKEFSHPGSEEKQPVDINRAIEATVTVASGEWKHVAEVVMELAPDLPLVPGLAGELKQVILNLIINAAHAIADVVGDGSNRKGKIAITTRREGDCIELTIADTGTGIPNEIRSRVFEPFFTSKPVGKGTGQGLALAHTIIVKGHEGQIWFNTEVGRGTTFFIRLRHEAKAQRAAQ